MVAFGSKGIEAGRAFIRLGTEGAQEVAKTLQKQEKSLKNLAKIGVAAGAALGTSLAAGAAAATAKFAAMGTQLAKLSKQTGDSVEQLSRMQFAARQLDIDPDDLSGAIEELNIRLGEAVQDGTGPLAESFKKLNLDAAALAKLPLDQRIGRIAEAVRKLPRTDRGFLADEIFGGDAFKILPLLDQGAAGIARLAEESDRMGATVTTHQAAAAQAVTDAWKDVKEVVGGLTNEVGSELAPAVASLLNELVPLIKSIAANVAPILTRIVSFADEAIERANRARKFLAETEKKELTPGKVLGGLAGGAALGGVGFRVTDIIGDAKASKPEPEDLSRFKSAGEALADALSTGARGALQDQRAAETRARRSTRDDARAAASLPENFGRGQQGVTLGDRIAGALTAAVTTAAGGVNQGIGAVGDIGVRARELLKTAAVESSAAGTFSSAAAARIGQGGGVDQRQLDQLERITRATEALEQLAEAGGIVWGTA